MSLSDCIECWNTPCTCGHEYQDWTVEALTKQRDMLDKIINEKLNECPCWFCHKPIKGGELRRMSSEFDCEVHETCLQKAINHPSSDGEQQEGEIMAAEFGIVPNEK